MTLELALAKIKMLEESNQRLSELVNYYLNRPGPSTIAYQQLLAKEKEDEAKRPQQRKSS